MKACLDVGTKPNADEACLPIAAEPVADEACLDDEAKPVANEACGGVDAKAVAARSAFVLVFKTAEEKGLEDSLFKKTSPDFECRDELAVQED